MRKYGLKRVYLFFSSILIFILHLPFVFAKSKPFEDLVKQTPTVQPLMAGNATGPEPAGSAASMARMIYDSLRLSSMGLTQQAYEAAIIGLNKLVEAGKIVNQNVISIIDFSRPSSKKRLFVIDLKNQKLLFNTYVAHGANSGEAMAERFSNAPESNQSSLGFYETADTYIGKHGYSMHLMGLERGINDNARSRDIVMHAADYVNEDLIQARGYIGRSWGCPAVSPELSKPIIDKIKNGTCLFIYSPDKNYYARTRLLNS